jgi:hypothetical protein
MNGQDGTKPCGLRTLQFGGSTPTERRGYKELRSAFARLLRRDSLLCAARWSGPVMAGAKRGLRAKPFEGPYTFLRNEPILFSRYSRCIICIYRNLCRLQLGLQMGSFWKNEPIFGGL